MSKQVNGPVLIHVLTTKGKGYDITEKNPDKFHATGPFNSETGEPKKAKSFRFKIDKYGTVMPADPLTDAYLLNPYKTNDRKTDFEKAINFKSKSY